MPSRGSCPWSASDSQHRKPRSDHFPCSRRLPEPHCQLERTFEGDGSAARAAGPPRGCCAPLCAAVLEGDCADAPPLTLARYALPCHSVRLGIRIDFQRTPAAVRDLGDAPFSLVQDLLPHSSAAQLAALEDNSPHIQPFTNGQLPSFANPSRSTDARQRTDRDMETDLRQRVHRGSQGRRGRSPFGT